jgi:hypothetical protein
LRESNIGRKNIRSEELKKLKLIDFFLGGGDVGCKGSEWRKDEYKIRKGWSQIITHINR